MENDGKRANASAKPSQASQAKWQNCAQLPKLTITENNV